MALAKLTSSSISRLGCAAAGMTGLPAVPGACWTCANTPGQMWGQQSEAGVSDDLSPVEDSLWSLAGELVCSCARWQLVRTSCQSAHSTLGLTRKTVGKTVGQEHLARECHSHVCSALQQPKRCARISSKASLELQG